MSNVLFRLDAGAHIGTGHLQRNLTLANQFHINGWTVYFAMIDFDQTFLELVKNAGYKLLLLPKGKIPANTLDEASWLTKTELEDVTILINKIYNKHFKVCIIDHYSIGEIWHKEIKKVIPIVVVIDDLANRYLNCDILIDQNYLPNFKTRYSTLTNHDCIQLLGPDYALLRDEFLKLRRYPKLKSTTSFPTILCTFGGVGNYSLLCQIVQAICNTKCYKYIIITGFLSEIEFNHLNLLIANNKNITMIKHSNNIAQLMTYADFCIGASGSTVWERFCLGLNSALISMADNQNELLNHLEQSNLIDNLGLADEIKSIELQQYLSLLDLADSKYSDRQKTIMSLVDGDGAKRVYNIIQGVLEK